MPPSVTVRREQWAQFVRRALANAEASRGWSVPMTAEQAGISDPTIYRWRDGRGYKSPLPEQVVAFCDALDIPVSRAFQILWPGKHDRPAPTEPPPLPEELVIIARKLEDPNVPDQEKYLLRESLRQLAARPNRPIDVEAPRRRTRG